MRADTGDMIVYPASNSQHVEPVTRGRRLVAVSWVQNMVRDDGASSWTRRSRRCADGPGRGGPAIVQLTGVYHNLLRR